MKKVILGLVAIAALVSCKKDDDNGGFKQWQPYY